jgi:hypothetical protein
MRKKELDVDFIGGVAPLTKAEEKRISEVIMELKAVKSPARKRAATKRVVGNTNTPA